MNPGAVQQQFKWKLTAHVTKKGGRNNEREVNLPYRKKTKTEHNLNSVRDSMVEKGLKWEILNS